MKVQVMTYHLVAFINPKSIYKGYNKNFNFRNFFESFTLHDLLYKQTLPKL